MWNLLWSCSLCPQRGALFDSKAMLFVDDRDCQTLESNIFAKKRVRADGHIEIARCKSIDHNRAIGGAQTASHSSNSNSTSFEHLFHSTQVLFCKNFRWCKQNCLMPVRNCIQHCMNCDGCFSRSNIALKQSIHWNRLGKIIRNFFAHLTLCISQYKRNSRKNFLLDGVCQHKRWCAHRISHLPSSHRHRKLQAEKFVISQACSATFRFECIFGGMDHSICIAQRNKAAPSDNLGSNQIDNRIQRWLQD